MQTAPQNVEVDDVRDIHAHLEVLLHRLDVDAVAACDATRMWELFSGITRFGTAGTTVLPRRGADFGFGEGARPPPAAGAPADLGGGPVLGALGGLPATHRGEKLARPPPAIPH